MLDLNEEMSNGTLKAIDERHLMVELQEGKLNKQKPCFVCDEKGEEYVILSAKILKTLLQGIKKAQEEKFAISLEKDIANQMPIDFDDVLSVAEAKINELGGIFSGIDTANLVREIKQEYPNLFFNIDEYLRK